eukprot:3520097-Pyramimonas_sp.AAC.1
MQRPAHFRVGGGRRSVSPPPLCSRYSSYYAQKDSKRAGPQRKWTRAQVALPALYWHTSTPQAATDRDVWPARLGA